MSRRGVQKGKEFERAVARMLRALDPKARRCLQYQMDHRAPDVQAGPLWVECKARRVHVASIYLTTAKAAQARPGAVPAVAHKSTQKGPVLVTLGLRDFVQLLAGSQAATTKRKGEKTGGPTPLPVLRDLLGLAGREAPLRVLRSWSREQRAQAQAWAAKVHLAASDNPVRVPSMPPHVAQLREIQ
jgi:hypothetical protein